MITLKRIYPNIIQEFEAIYYRMTLDMNNIIESVLKLMGGAFGVKIFDFWLEKYKEKKEKKQTDRIIANLKDISDMNVIMSDIVTNTEATRFLIFRGHDSGSVPNPKHPYFTKCLWQQVKNNDDVERLKKRYESIQVDVPYINMMIQILVNGVAKIKVSEMPDCLLKELYKSEGVEYSEVHFLAQEKSNFIYYCSIATTKTGEDFSDIKQRVEIDLAVNSLRQIFQRI